MAGTGQSCSRPPVFTIGMSLGWGYRRGSSGPAWVGVLGSSYSLSSPEEEWADMGASFLAGALENWEAVRPGRREELAMVRGKGRLTDYLKKTGCW